MARAVRVAGLVGEGHRVPRETLVLRASGALKATAGHKVRLGHKVSADLSDRLDRRSQRESEAPMR